MTFARRRKTMTMFKNILSAAVVTLITATTAMAGQGVRPIELTPEHGQSFDLGNQRAVSYFLSLDGVCNLTLMLADALTNDEALPGAATRMNLVVAPGRPARVDTPTGKSLGFECGENAASMTVVPMQQVAWTPRR
jgi:hypothetical protein